MDHNIDIRWLDVVGNFRQFLKVKYVLQYKNKGIYIYAKINTNIYIYI